ncbi:hypothetical protein ACB092_05G085600 [Castanea dentata]
MEAISSTSSSLRRRAPLRCYCAEKPVLVISWTADNHSRRFYGCPNYWVGRKCKFFQWCDDEICERGKMLILEQRQQITRLEVQGCKMLQEREVFHYGFGILIGDMWDLSL